MDNKIQEDLEDWQESCSKCYKSYGNCCIIEELPECEIDRKIKEIQSTLAE